MIKADLARFYGEAQMFFCGVKMENVENGVRQQYLTRCGRSFILLFYGAQHPH